MAKHSMPDTDALAKTLAPMVREMLLDQVRKVAAAREDAVPNKADADIMAACLAVARASDALAQARFSGGREIPARLALIRACDVLSRTMRKHGRMPRGE